MTELNTTDREKFICDCYLNRTYNTKELEKKFKIYPNEIYSVLKKHGIELRGGNLPKEKIKNICEKYKNGSTINQICNTLNVSESCVMKYLKENNIKTRREAGRFIRKYELDESILQNIDTFEKAQFLGLIYSDGSLSKYNKNISIRLREDDKDYLEDWRIKFLKSNKPLNYTYTPTVVGPLTGQTYQKKFGSYILEISSSSVYQDALAIGLCPNKTKANLPMPNIPNDLKIGFILGLFEGDGTVGFSASNKSCYFSIACQEHMGLDIKHYFNSVGICSHFYKRKYICDVRVMKKEDMQKLHDLLYKDCAIFMSRKKKKFQEVLNAF